MTARAPTELSDAERKSIVTAYHADGVPAFTDTMLNDDDRIVYIAGWNAAIEASAKLCEQAASKGYLTTGCAIAIRAMRKGTET